MCPLLHSTNPVAEMSQLRKTSAGFHAGTWDLRRRTRGIQRSMMDIDEVKIRKSAQYCKLRLALKRQGVHAQRGMLVHMRHGAKAAFRSRQYHAEHRVTYITGRPGRAHLCLCSLLSREWSLAQEAEHSFVAFPLHLYISFYCTIFHHLVSRRNTSE